MTRSSAETQLDSFLAKYTPEIRSAGRAAVGKLRTRFPGAVVLVYDNYNALAIGFGPTERPSDVVFSIALFPRWVNLFFLQGADLPDPAGRLEGTGKRVRQIVLEGPETLDQPDVRALLALAAARARPPFDEAKPGRLVIQSISVKQRPRRPQRDGGRASRRGSEGARSRRRGDASPARRKG